MLDLKKLKLMENHIHPDWRPMLGLTAVTGDERTGKTTLLRRLAGEAAELPPHGQFAHALWLDLSLPESDDQTPQQVWEKLRHRCPLWNNVLQDDLTTAFSLEPHLGKKLYMLSTEVDAKWRWLPCCQAGLV